MSKAGSLSDARKEEKSRRGESITLIEDFSGEKRGKDIMGK